MRKTATSLTFVVALTGALVAGPVSPAHAEKPTPYGLAGFGIGSLVDGGELPVTSGPIGKAVIACTNLAGITRNNTTASVSIPGLGELKGVATRVWTRKEGGTVSIFSRHRIADVGLAETELGSLSVSGLESWTRAWHDSDGYHAAARTSVLSIQLTSPDGETQNLDVPSPGNPTVIPDLLRISVGEKVVIERPHRSEAMATALEVKLLATDTTVRLARAKARMGDAAFGVFSGIAYGVKGSAVDNMVGIGRTPVEYQPCAGTDGEIKTANVAGVNLPDVGTVGALEASVRSKAIRGRAQGYSKAQTAAVSLFDGRLEIEGITAKASVERVRGEGIVRRSTDGTRVLGLTVDGEPREIPLEGLEIEGLVRIEEGIVTMLPSGLKVTALRLTLLNGTGAVIDLGVAKMLVGRLPN